MIDLSVPLLGDFIGRVDDFALQNPDGSYTRQRRPLTRADLEAHLAGNVTVGAYSTDSDGMVRYFCIDIDTDGSGSSIADAQLLAEEIRAKADVPLSLEFSGGKGWHLWGLLRNPKPWEQALDAARTILYRHGGFRLITANKALHEPTGFMVDIFPAGLGAEGLGKLVKLPGALHRKSGKRSVLYDTTDYIYGDLPYDPAAAQVERTVKLWDGTRGRLPLRPWMHLAMKRGLPDGFRNNGLHYVASWLVLRTTLSAADIYDAVHCVNALSTPPLGDDEVERTIRSAARNPRQGSGEEEFINHGVVSTEECGK